GGVHVHARPILRSKPAAVSAEMTAGGGFMSNSCHRDHAPREIRVGGKRKRDTIACHHWRGRSVSRERQPSLIHTCRYGDWLAPHDDRLLVPRCDSSLGLTRWAMLPASINERRKWWSGSRV